MGGLEEITKIEKITMLVKKIYQDKTSIKLN